MSDRMYNAVKNTALILAPVVVLIISLLQTFDVIDNEIGISIASAVDTFLGAIVVVAKQIYDSKNKNEVIETENTGEPEG